MTPDEVRDEMDRGRHFRIVPPSVPAEPADDTLAHVWADDIALNVEEPGLVDGLLDAEGLGVVYGSSGSGKTFATLDLACHIAAGLPWRGMPVQQGVVVYVAAEAPESVQRRLWAWKNHHRDKVDSLPVAVVTASVDLLNGSTEEVIALVGKIREERGPVRLVVVDTLARSMTGDENSGLDMGRYVASCAAIREAAAGHLLIVHHCGKDEARGARGHSSLRAAVDGEWEIVRTEAGRALTVRKSRDGEAEGRTFGFALERVELGTNRLGRMVTTAVAVTCDPPGDVTDRKRRALGAVERTVLDLLGTALADHGREPPPEPDIPHRVRVVAVEKWREAAERYLTNKHLKHRTQAFNRALETLVAARMVRHVNGLAWLPPTEGHKVTRGHTTPHVTSCDRAEASPPPDGHTVTRVFRPCDRVTGTGEGDREEGTARKAAPNGPTKEEGRNLAPSRPPPASNAPRRVWTPEGIYRSLRQAGRAAGLNEDGARKRVLRGTHGWRYAEAHE